MYIFVLMSPYIIAVAKKNIVHVEFSMKYFNMTHLQLQQNSSEIRGLCFMKCHLPFFQRKKTQSFFLFPIWETLNFGQNNNFGFHFTEIWQILYYILQKLISASIIFEEWQTHSSFWKMQYYWLVADPVPKTLVSRFLFATQIALRQV